MAGKRIALISTGGTIEKTYDERDGTLVNDRSVLDVMLSKLQLRGIEVTRVALMNKDSLEMTDEDHASIAGAACEQGQSHDGVVIVHGTDRLAETGEAIVALCPRLAAPVVLTGAMRPFEMHNTDAMQNLTEALLAAQLLPPGVYVAMHNQILSFPGVVKDHEARTFRKVVAT